MLCKHSYIYDLFGFQYPQPYRLAELYDVVSTFIL